MQKVKPVNPCADSSDTPRKTYLKAPESSRTDREGNRWYYRSAAMLGLAISMGATGILLPNHQKQAVAADSKTWELAVTSLPLESQKSNSSPKSEVALKPNALTPESTETENVQIAPPSVKHEVKKGETIWKLSEQYQVAPEEIATSNQLKPDANLLVGQRLKIPAVDETSTEVKENELAPELAQSDRVDSPTRDSASKQLSVGEANTIPGKVDYLLQQQQNDALKNLEQEQDYLNKAKETQANQALPQVTALSNPLDETDGVKIPVSLPDSQRSANPERQNEASVSRPVVIPVSQPESQSPPTYSSSGEAQANRPVLLPVLPAKTETSPKQGQTEVGGIRPQASPLTPNQQSVTPNPTQQESPNLIAYDRPVPIPVPPPESSAVGNFEQKQAVLTAPIPIEPRQQQEVLPSPSSPSVISSKQVYRVQRGDTLNSIARNYGVSRQELIQANNIHNPNLIKLNQQLIIPQTNLARNNPPTKPLMSETSQVQSSTNPHLEKLKTDVERLQQQYQGTEGSSEAITIAVQPMPGQLNPSKSGSPEALNPEWSSDRQSNQTRKYQQPESNQQLARIETRQPTPRASSPRSNLVSTAPTNPTNYNQIGNPVGETVSPDLPILSPEPYLPDSQSFNGYVWPTKGVITSGYGWRWGRMHKGIDIAAPIGTPIMAAASGEVVFAGWNSGGYGNLVKVKHPNGSITLYAHNSRLLVRRGQKVEQGQQIAQMGSTGYSTGPHLHFEVHPNGQGAANPVAYLPRKR